MNENWTPKSWRTRPTAQQPVYADDEALRAVLEQLALLPPLVTSWEVETLREQLAEAADGRRFLLQGGDCCESFADCTSSIIVNKLKILLQMSLVLVYGAKQPVIRVGRFAGQYAKPRSSDMETRDGVSLPSYRGDNINSAPFAAKHRDPDPQRLLRGHANSSMTLNFVRGLSEGGFADLHHPELWDLDFVEQSRYAKDYRSIVEAIGNAIEFMETVSAGTLLELKRVGFFTSHEGLHLDYEQSQLREVPHHEGWYNLSTHFPWIGERTRNVDGGHVEFFRGIQNPIGIKVGPTTSPEDLTNLIRVLDHDGRPGRITLIHRFGEKKIGDVLPSLIQAIDKLKQTVLWCCDPMHGNTEATQSGIKTRRFDAILSELEQAFDIHQQHGSRLGGVHFELTGENVTECLGGASGIRESDLGMAYSSQVDPRLNYEQAMEMALLIARRMR